MSTHDRIPAKAGDGNRWGVTLYHNTCGSRIMQMYNGAFQCVGECTTQWKARIMQGFTDAEMAERFHKRPDTDPDDYVIVWRTDDFSKRRYSCTIKKSELLPTDEPFTL